MGVSSVICSSVIVVLRWTNTAVVTPDIAKQAPLGFFIYKGVTPLPKKVLSPNSFSAT